ncbi:MAG: BsuPI-related putative proteinase inhibitor [Planctomycetota bacterium]|jgi:hypothetical protein
MKIRLPLLIWIFLISGAVTANAEIVSNSLIVDDIEYYMQADDSIYDLGEDVEMLYRVTNFSDEEVSFTFGGDPEWNFWVEKDGETTWTAVEGWWSIIVNFTLLPDESKEYPWVWDMMDSGGALVEPGVYDIIGGFDAGAEELYEFSKVPVSITVVPEPSSLVLFMAGLSVLFRKRKS